MAGSSVARREAPSVPALAPTPATTIGAEDVAIPRLYIGNFMSEAVKAQLVKFGDVFLALGPDDTDPQVLWSLDQKADAGVLFHVLHLRKAKSWSPSPGAPLQLYDFDDPQAPEDAWTTYNYVLFLPEVDPDMPARLLLTKSGKTTAQKINTVLLRNASSGPDWLNAFRLTSLKRRNDKGEFAVAQVAIAEANPKHQQRAGELFTQIRRGLEQRSTTTSGPVDEPGI